MPTALKKLALMIGTNPKSARVLVGIIIGLIVIVFMPVALILHIFSSDNLKIDSSTLIQTVESQLSQEELAAIEQVNTIGMAIQSQMAEQGLDADQIREAQVLYVLALSNYSTADDFVEKLSGCFETGQTDQQLISAVNSAFGTTISSSDFSTIMTRVRSTYISVSNYEVPEEKNNLDLVHYAINAKESGWGYVWGTYGQVLTRSAYESQLSMYPTEVGRYADFITSNWIGRRTADCVGLIKGYGWLNAETSEIVYGSNGMPDITADDMYNAATVKGPISTIPEIPGLAVWHVGHIGIYIGNGQVIEAMGTRYGVVQTQTPARWTHWLKIPFIHYIDPAEQEGESNSE